jgi:hypothetical protein
MAEVEVKLEGMRLQGNSRPTAATPSDLVSRVVPSLPLLHLLHCLHLPNDITAQVSRRIPRCIVQFVQNLFAKRIWPSLDLRLNEQAWRTWQSSVRGLQTESV